MCEGKQCPMMSREAALEARIRELEGGIRVALAENNIAALWGLGRLVGRESIRLERNSHPLK